MSKLGPKIPHTRQEPDHGTLDRYRQHLANGDDPCVTAAGALVGILENPRLDYLRAIAKLLDGQLEDAADWSREVAQKIREALAE